MNLLASKTALVNQIAEFDFKCRREYTFTAVESGSVRPIPEQHLGFLEILKPNNARLTQGSTKFARTPG